MIIAEHEDLRVHEWSSGYEIEHIPSGQTCWMSDGVDMFWTIGEDGEIETVSPGTAEFNRIMQDDLESDYNSLMEAYFPDLVTE